MKEMNVEMLSKVCGVSSGTLRVWANRVNVGTVYDGSLNTNYTVTKLIEKFGSKKELDEVLGFNSDELQLVRNVRESNTYCSIDEVEVGEVVLIYNYSFKKERKLVEVLESEVYGNIYLFEGSNSKNDSVLDVYREEDFNKDSIKISKYFN